MKRFLVLLGLLLTLGAGFQSAHAQPMRTAVLTPNPCASVTLSLNFTTKSYCINGTRYGDFLSVPGASFTRASTGTAQDSLGNVISFASGVPRITDLGLLVEESRTNLLLWSQDLSNAAWGKTDSTITTAAAAAPDGTTTANLVTEGSAGNAQVNQAVTISAGQSLVVSRMFKRGNSDWVLIKVDSTAGANGFGKWFNLNTGALGSNYSFGTGTYTSARIVQLANGWYRCIVVGLVDAAATTAAVRTFNTSGDNTETRVNGATRYEWGADFNAGVTFALSYIPTTSASVTRAADNPLVSFGSSFTPGTMFAKVYGLPGSGTPASGNFQVFDSNGPPTWMQINTSKQLQSLSGAATLTDGTLSDLTTVNKLAMSWDGTTRRAVANGGTVSTDASAPGSASGLRLWTLNGYYQQVQVLSGGLGSAQLQALTQ